MDDSRNRRRMQLWAAVFLCVWVWACLAHAQNFQLWDEVDLTASAGKVDFLIPLLARTDTNLPNPQLAATGIVADFAMPRHLTFTAGYLFADLPQRSTKVHVPLVAVSKTFHWGPLTVVDRNRFEQLFGYGVSPVRYRNRLLADYAFGVQRRWHIFADDELFSDLTAVAWNQNRFRSGAGARLSRRLLLDLYYLQRNPSGGTPVTRVLGTTLTVKLTPR